MNSSPNHKANNSLDERQEFQSSNGFQLNPSQQHAPTSEMSLSSSTIQHNSREHGSNSDRKRNRRTMSDDSALDDILGQITSKLTVLSTKDNHTENDHIKVFTDVLNCTATEARFYLESSNWNVETAAMLWLENNPNGSQSNSYLTGGFNAMSDRTYGSYCRNVRSTGSTGILGSAGISNIGMSLAGGNALFRSREVIIPDLTEGWTARVSRSTGQVFFIHLATGTTQFSVPPGYADPQDIITTSITNTENKMETLDEEHQDHKLEGMEDDGNHSATEEGGGSSAYMVSRSTYQPTSPTGLQPCTYPQNALLEGFPTQSNRKFNSEASSFVSNSHNRDRGNSNDSGSIFRRSMDAVVYSDTEETALSSNRAVWDEGSGYSIADANFSISSTTDTSSNYSPLFSSMHATHQHSSNTNAYTNTSNYHETTTTANNATTALVEDNNMNLSNSTNHSNASTSNLSVSSTSQSNGNIEIFSTITTVNGTITTNTYPDDLMTQDNTNTADTTAAHTNTYIPSSSPTTTAIHPSSTIPAPAGIAMTTSTPIPTDDSSGYFLGQLSPNTTSSRNSSAGNLTL